MYWKDANLYFWKKNEKKQFKGLGVVPIKVVGYYSVGNQIVPMRKWGDLQLTWQMGFELQWPFVVHYNSMYFYGCECYWTSCMSCNKCNSLYVKLYIYTTPAI